MGLAIAVAMLFVAAVTAKTAHRTYYRRYSTGLTSNAAEVKSLKAACVILGASAIIVSALFGCMGGLLAYWCLWQRVIAYLASLGVSAIAAVVLAKWLVTHLRSDGLADFILGFPAWWRMGLAAIVSAALAVATAGTISVVGDADQRAALWKALGLPTVVENRETRPVEAPTGEGGMVVLPSAEQMHGCQYPSSHARHAQMAHGQESRRSA